MFEYKILVNKELAEMLEFTAKGKNMSAEQFIREILNKYLVPLHTINQEEMAKGYQEMADINLELSK